MNAENGANIALGTDATLNLEGAFEAGDAVILELSDGAAVSRGVTTICNNGGKDVVQLYVKAPRKGLDKPERELKGFAKTPELDPGESCDVEIFISKESLASYDEAAGSWVTAKGRYTFIAAKDALDKSKRKRVRLLQSLKRRL